SIERWITEIVGRREYLEVGQMRDWCDLLVVGNPPGRHVVDSLVIFPPVDTLAGGRGKLEAFQRPDDVRRLYGASLLYRRLQREDRRISAFRRIVRQAAPPLGEAADESLVLLGVRPIPNVAGRCPELVLELARRDVPGNALHHVDGAAHTLPPRLDVVKYTKRRGLTQHQHRFPRPGRSKNQIWFAGRQSAEMGREIGGEEWRPGLADDLHVGPELLQRGMEHGPRGAPIFVVRA